MSKIVLDEIASGYQLSKVNENFQKIEDELNNKVLYRNPPSGEPNTVEKDIDFNGYKLYNVGDIQFEGFEGWTDLVQQATEAAADSEASRDAAAISEANAAASAADASAYAGRAVVRTFSGNGSTVAFDLVANPLNKENTQVFIGSVYQRKSTYSVSGNILTFNTAPPAGTNNIEVVIFESVLTESGVVDITGGEIRDTTIYYGDTTVEDALSARIPEIGNYAELRAYSGPVTAYYVRGVANIFDGGAGVFRVDAADTTTADNGGTVLVDASGRRWKREFSGPVHALWFGVSHLGVETTDELREALEYLKPTGGELQLSPGTVLSEKIDLRQYYNVTITGAGEYSGFQYRTTTVLKCAATCSTFIQLADDDLEVPRDAWLATGIVIRNLAIDGNGLATQCINMCRAVRLENAKVFGAVQDGVVLEGGSYPVHLQSVIGQMNGRHGLVVKGPFTTVYTVRDSEFGYNGGTGVVILDGSTALFENVLCQSNGGNGWTVLLQDRALFSHPLYLERITFLNCYSEANDGWGFWTDSYNTDPTTYTGKITDLTFVNCSFNSGIAQNARLRGLANTRTINSPYLDAALDPAFNTVYLDRAAQYGETDWTARISQSQTNYFTTSGAIRARYQRVGNWVNCTVHYSWSDKGTSNDVFFAKLDLPVTALGGTFVHGATRVTIRVPGGSTDEWAIVPIGGTDTAQFVKNNSDSDALIGDLPAAGTLSATFSYIAA